MKKKPLIIVIGAYGSGKSEYAINLAWQFKNTEKGKVSLADLDIINPFFRSRDLRSYFLQEQIEVVAPEEAYANADLPIITPAIKGAIEDQNKIVILDCGGDPAGCRVLGLFIDSILVRGYEMHFVVNTNRPFTSTVEEIITMKQMLEKSSGLQINEIVCNTNLMQFTTVDVVTDGLLILHQVAEKENLILRKYLVFREWYDDYPLYIHGVQKVSLDYFLRKPWEK